MSVTEPQAQALATLLHMIRPEWHLQSLMTLMHKHRDDHEFPELCAAAITIANDQQKRTPAIIFMDGKHWDRPSQQYTTAAERKLEAGAALIQKYAALEGVPMATGTKRAMVGLELARQLEAEERNRQAPMAIDTSTILEEPEPTA